MVVAESAAIKKHFIGNSFGWILPIHWILPRQRCVSRLCSGPRSSVVRIELTRYKGQLKLKDRAFAIAKRSTMRKARVALARRLGIIMHAMLRDGTEFASA
jgi:hypothetical protein